MADLTPQMAGVTPAAIFISLILGTISVYYFGVYKPAAIRKAKEQDWEGKTSLIRACEKKDKVAAALVMEATKKAGALDYQVTEDRGWCEGCG